MSSYRLRLATGLAGLALLLASPATLAQTERKLLTPQEAVKLAQQHSPALRAALIEAQRARLAVRGEEHRYLPSLSAELGYNRSAMPSVSGTGTVTTGTGDELALRLGISQRFAVGTLLSAELELSGEGRDAALAGAAAASGPNYGVALRLSVTQPLLRGLGTDVGEAELRAARVSRRAADHKQAKAASEMVRDVLSAYWELWYAERALEIRRQGLVVTKRQLAEAEQKARAGAIARVEVLPLRTEVASIEEVLIAARTEVRRREVALARLTGTPLTGATRLATTTAAPPQGPAMSPAEAERVAREFAYDLAELEAAIAQSGIQLDVARDRLAPQLDVQAGISLAGLGNEDFGAAFEQFGTFGAVGAFVGLRLEMPVDQTQLRSEADRARLAVAGAKERLGEMQDRLGAQAVELVETLDATDGRMRLAEETAGLAAESFEAQQVKFQSGAGTGLDLVVAQQQQRQAELRVARARTDAAVTRAALEHLTAELLTRVAGER